LPDLSTRARAAATRLGRLGGTMEEQRVTTWLRFVAATGKVTDSVAHGVRPTAEDLQDALFELAVVTGLWGAEISDSVEVAVTRREMGLRRRVVGSQAAVPNAESNDPTLRDPVSKLPAAAE
jgi:uncharacterized membrane protein